MDTLNWSPNVYIYSGSKAEYYQFVREAELVGESPVNVTNAAFSLPREARVYIVGTAWFMPNFLQTYRDLLKRTKDIVDHTYLGQGIVAVPMTGITDELAERLGVSQKG